MSFGTNSYLRGVKMDKNRLESTLQKLFAKKKAIIVSISGDWGVGKTYFWKHFAEQTLTGKQAFAYISLFGKEHYKDIIEEIIFKLFDKENKKIQNISRVLTNAVNYMAKIASGGILNLNINPQTIFSLLKKENFSNIVICFDDIERLSNKLDIRDFLGLLSQLKEDKHCKIVLILNQNQLQSSHARDFDKFSEKTIDINLRYTPSIENSFEIASNIVKDDTNNSIFKIFNQEQILKIFKDINLDNIRLIIYILETLSDFAEELQKFDELNEDFTNQLLVSIINTLTCLKIFGCNETTFAFFKKYSDFFTTIVCSELFKSDRHIDKTQDKEKDYLEYLEIKSKFPNFIKYKKAMETYQGQTNELVKIIEFYYKHSYISTNNIAYLKEINIKKNIDKAVHNVFEINALVTDWTTSVEPCSEAYKRLTKMYSYKDNVYLYDKIASYNEGFRCIEDIINTFKPYITNLSLSSNNFYQTIFDNINSLKIDNETKNELLDIIFVNNSQNPKIQDFKEKWKSKILTTREILLNTQRESNSKHIERVNALTKNDIKNFITTDKEGLTIVLKDNTNSDIFRKNKDEALKELQKEDKNYSNKLQIIYRMERIKNSKKEQNSNK